MLDELNELIAELEQEEHKTSQALERKREERKRLEMQIKMMGQKEERNRIHKMIVLGSTICAEMKKWKGGNDLYNRLLQRNDKAMVIAGEMIANGYAQAMREKENSDSV